MTTEELAVKWERDAVRTIEIDAPGMGTIANVLRQCAAELRALGDGWISVEERFPEEGQHVLVSTNDDWQFIAWILDESDGEWHGFDPRIMKLTTFTGITYWRALVAPPTRKEG